MLVFYCRFEFAGWFGHTDVAVGFCIVAWFLIPLCLRVLVFVVLLLVVFVVVCVLVDCCSLFAFL